MTTIDNMDFSIGHISPVGFRLRGVKRCLILAPNHQQARLLLTHPGLPPGIVVDVGAIVVEEVALNLDLAGLIEESKFIRPQIGVIAFHVGIASDMARPRRLQRQEVGTKRAFVGDAVGPKGPTRLPDRTQTLIVRYSILDYETLDSVRMGQGHAKTHGAAVILHVKRVARETKSFSEVSHGFGDVIERAREFFRFWPVTVSEAGVIGRDKVRVIGTPGNKSFEHP